VLVHECNVFIILNEPQPRQKLVHYLILKVSNNSELLEIRVVPDHFLLNLNVLVILVVKNLERKLIGIVVQIYEPVVQKEPVVTFLTITIINLLPPLDVFHCFYDKTLSIISVSPCCLSRSPMIQHVCISNKTISLDTFYLNPKYTTANHHSDL
jgi:hypothetical protein